MRTLSSLALVALVAMTGCPKKLPGGMPDHPDVPGGVGGASEVDPDTCGNYAVGDAGRKLHAFLEATVELQKAVNETVEVELTSCKMMGAELKMAPGDLEGNTNDVCARVITELQHDIKVGVKSQAALVITYKPAVCTVDASLEAKAKAECEGSASGSATTGTGGSSSSGASQAQCQAAAKVHASVSMECTEPELTVTLQKPLVIDAAKAELAVNAMTKGLPKILSVKERLKPLGAAVDAWAVAAGELSKVGGELARSFKDQAMCITGQIAAVASAVTNIHASLSVSVSVSASASGTIGGK
jgi:hypothetical protein